MTKKLFAVLMISLLSGCVNDSDFSQLQSQVNQLNTKLTTAENELQVLKKEVAEVKNQRVVRLPTGAPSATRQRNEKSPYGASEPELLLSKAMEDYKSGNVQSAIKQLEYFGQTYANDKDYIKAMYYLGEAHYTIRHYDKAQKILESLVYQSSSGQLDEKSINLLEKIYTAQGNESKINELNNFKNSL